MIARLAGSQHGVVTHAQLLAAGVTPAQIRHRLAIGYLLRVHRGVFRVGHAAPVPEARYAAAVLAAGAGSLLAGPACAHLLELIGGRPPLPTVWAPTERRIPGVRVRRCRRLETWPRGTHSGIPCTTVPWTLLDLASVVTQDVLERAVHQAVVRHRMRPEQVLAALARRPNAPGVALLRLVACGDDGVVLSRLERRFRALLREHGLPLPQANRLVDGHYVDCRWPRHRLTVELDSYRFHASRRAWEQSIRREREAYARGDQFRRYAWGDVFERPAPMLAELAPLLLRRPA